MTSSTEKKREKVHLIHQQLQDEYGTPTLEPHNDAIATLVNTILSQNTNDHNRDIAFQQLRERYPTWEAVRDAPTDKLIEAIRPAGLGASKGPRIQGALKKISEEQGELTLEFLNEMPLSEARAWLLKLKGVGPKTAAIVLLFAMGRPAFPVDTHVHRVTRRLGLIPDETSREKAHTLLEDMVPEKLYYALHLNIISHGRQVCHARSPECERCKLQKLCDYYASQKETGGSHDT